jgi:hypothetical protein
VPPTFAVCFADVITPHRPKIAYASAPTGLARFADREARVIKAETELPRVG